MFPKVKAWRAPIMTRRPWNQSGTVTEKHVESLWCDAGSHWFSRIGCTDKPILETVAETHRNKEGIRLVNCGRCGHA